MEWHEADGFDYVSPGTYCCEAGKYLLYGNSIEYFVIMGEELVV